MRSPDSVGYVAIEEVRDKPEDVPNRSPIRLPKADPQAAAGPNSSEQTIGITFAGRTSVRPGTIGIATLNGMRIAA